MMIGAASSAMMSGCLTICSPWNPNSSTSVASSAMSEIGCKLRQGARERRLPALCQQRSPPQLGGNHRHDNVEHDGEEQRRPWHRDRRQAKQQRYDRGKSKHHDGVVERDLAQSEIRAIMSLTE